MASRYRGPLVGTIHHLRRPVRCRYAEPMAIFGRRTARQRLRKAAQESLAIPAFSSPPDCTPWVIGGLWPTELSRDAPETATLAEYLEADLQRIADSANEELASLRHAVMLDSDRRAAEARVIDDARARAVQRVESARNQLREGASTEPPVAPPDVADPNAAEPGSQPQPPTAGRPDAVDAARAAARAPAPAVPESDDQRLRRLLMFVARQEPRLNWAIGQRPEGTVLVTDVAHGWIPPGIALPQGVRLLPPKRRSGRLAALVDAATGLLSYSPGDPLPWADEDTATRSSVRPRELPMADNVARELCDATRSRVGLPRMAHVLAKAADAGTAVVEDEIDLLRVHLDTARHEVMARYPSIDGEVLLNCMLLAATASSVSGDAVTANYHLAWFRELNA